MSTSGRNDNAVISQIDIPAQHPGLSRADVYAFVEAWSMQRKRVSLDDYLGWTIAQPVSAATDDRDDVAQSDRSGEYRSAS